LMNLISPSVLGQIVVPNIRKRPGDVNGVKPVFSRYRMSRSASST
jgi:hypothetical protein